MSSTACTHPAPPAWHFAGAAAVLSCLIPAHTSAARVGDRAVEACPVDVVATVAPAFMDDESAPAVGRYLWSYEVTVVNGSKLPLRLVGRAWVATDALGAEHRFGGAGLVGKQPDLPAGTRYGYTSWMALPTPSGVMTGSLLAELPGGTDCTVAAGTTRLQMRLSDE